MGRKAVPKNLRIARGTNKANPERINQHEPDVPDGRPVPPKWLTNKDALEEWDRICDILEGMGVLSPAYTAALELYCTSFAKWREAYEKVEKHGVAMEIKDGRKVIRAQRSAYASEMHRYHAECLKILAEFGLTPSAKTKVMSDPTSTGSPKLKKDFFPEKIPLVLKSK